MRLDQGLHDESKDIPVDQDSMKTRRSSDMTDNYDELNTLTKHLSDLVLDSNRDTASKKIQIVTHLSVANLFSSAQHTDDKNAQVAYQDLDESMMELSQQVEEMMTNQQIKTPKLKPTSYTHHKLGQKNIEAMQLLSNGSYHIDLESALANITINTPFAIQTKSGKK